MNRFNFKFINPTTNVVNIRNDPSEEEALKKLISIVRNPKELEQDILNGTAEIERTEEVYKD